MIDKRFGKRVKACREQLCLTQEQFAEKIGLTPNYISTVERVTAFPRYDKLIAIVNGLEVSAERCSVTLWSMGRSIRHRSYPSTLEKCPARNSAAYLRWWS